MFIFRIGPRVAFGWVVLLFCALLSLAYVAMVAAQAPVADADATKPASRMNEGWWAERHKQILAAVARHPDPEVLLIGDSITNNYDKAKLPDENFQPTWQKFYAPRRAINLGFSGDTTSHVLWRLQHGEVAGLQPKVVVLLIGTNDTGYAGRGAEQTERGIGAVVVELKQRLPGARVLLLGILPSGISVEKTATDRAINSSLAATYAADPRVTYLDIAPVFYLPDGQLNAAIYYDPRLPQHGKPLHPDTNGQRKMAEAIEPALAKLLGESPVADGAQAPHREAKGGGEL